MENTHTITPGIKQSESAVVNKEELVAAFSQLSDEAKAQFYKDCEEGVPAEISRQNMLNYVRQLWKK